MLAVVPDVLGNPDGVLGQFSILNKQNNILFVYVTLVIYKKKKKHIST